ncbi:MAG: hypothetical protein AAGF27_11465 [Pseudomonadota bacterium]
MRSIAFIGLFAALAAGCAAPVPNQSRGAGFDSVVAIEARNAELEGDNLRVPTTVLPPEGGTGAPAPLTGVTAVPGSAEDTAAQTTAILEQTRPGSVPSQPAAQSALDNAGISAENDFDVVSEQRTIEGDAERLAQNRAQYQVIEPEALPERSGSDQPNIVAFALSTSHPVGTPVYARAGLNGAARAERNCREYASPDQAQIDFLARGGPLRDRRGLDPDGDGYACDWNPAPFRNASSG